MDCTKLINIKEISIPEESKKAFEWNQRLAQSAYQPPMQVEMRADGSLAIFISADTKAVLFFDACQKAGKEGRIINDDVTFNQFGDMVMVQSKAYVYIDDVLKGTGVAGQCFRIGAESDMDLVVQYASGLAKSRALTNAGYGVVSSITIPGNSPALPCSNDSPLPFMVGNLPENASSPAGGCVMPSQTPSVTPAMMPAAMPQQMPSVNPNDPTVWAKGVYWAAKKATLGDLLTTTPKVIKWAAETMAQDSDIKRGAVILYATACQMLGVAPKQLQ